MFGKTLENGLKFHYNDRGTIFFEGEGVGVREASTQTSAEAIRLEGLCKSFGPVRANHNVSLTVKQGEILALLGENGSGKTTLVNMLSGIYKPDSGTIYLHGRPVAIRSPREAIALGVGMIHQHFKLVDVLTARENILLGAGGRLKQPPEELQRQFGLECDLNKKIYNMSVGEKQTVEILKVLSRGADILILDEPTAVLTPQETEKLFAILRKMRQEGHAVVIITHKLQEVLDVSDRVTILRKGESIDTVVTAETSVQELTEKMVGRPVSLKIQREEQEPGGTLLDVHELSVTGEDGVKRLDRVSFQLYEGEILGVCGVAGSGQKELCEAIAGLQKVDGGTILLSGQRVDGLSPREIIHKGISLSFIPEDRLGMGLVGGMSITDNMMLKTYADQKGFFLKRRPARELAARLVRQLDISTPSIQTPVQKLSGGNVQKVLLGREIEAEPKVLITAYPVRGLDINSSYTIYDLLNEQKRKGVGVLFVGEDLDVLLELCDRIVVLCGGRVTAIIPGRFATKELLGMKMTGLMSQEEMEDDYV